MTEEELLAISSFASEQAMRFMRESGNTLDSVCNRGHDAAIDAILERGGEPADYEIVPWVVDPGLIGQMVEIRVVGK